MGRGKNRELLFKGYRVSVWDNENFPEMDGGRWLHNNVKSLNATESVHLKMVQIINFLLHEFSPIIIKRSVPSHHFCQNRGILAGIDSKQEDQRQLSYELGDSIPERSGLIRWGQVIITYPISVP